ncbi:hypothetical protein Pmani_000884 [Petrolisthes manimaculis]|uniref:Uncharacterized protein n=1 Tax=Petrolisthes manimaculis TaxID=1843537 RepID=A0AAE1Q8C2_9EUCA|nr:hypothetical protein Pmani_016153 [Petrolisthes manimaculis]KAK4320382.1 hypothetical protein Pmani_008761 [Petrolisthes manimaculis]KAK4328687.1 hypothetical protein Pmani_000884 [Petrolisthes manimaculis]
MGTTSLPTSSYTSPDACNRTVTVAESQPVHIPPEAHQHSNNPSQTLHHNARTLLWVEDLKSEDNFLVDSWSEVNMVPPYPPTLWIHYPH